MICKVFEKYGKICPGIKNYHCSVYTDEGVTRHNKTNICPFRDIRIIKTTTNKKKLNPLKEAKRKGGK